MRCTPKDFGHEFTWLQTMKAVLAGAINDEMVQLFETVKHCAEVADRGGSCPRGSVSWTEMAEDILYEFPPARETQQGGFPLAHELERMGREADQAAEFDKINSELGAAECEGVNG